MKKTITGLLITVSCITACNPQFSLNSKEKDEELGVVIASGDLGKITTFVALEEDFDINACCINNRTPLQHFVDRGNRKMAKFFLTHGANPNTKDKIAGMTALMIAVDNGQLELVRMLLAQGADPSLVNNYRQTALSMAQKRGHKAIVSLLQNNQVNIPLAEMVVEAVDPKARADAYAAMIAKGESPAFATTYADTKVLQLQAGKSDDWAGAYAAAIASGKSPAYATTYADTKVLQLQTGKSDDWADAYAAMIAQGKLPAFATTYPDNYEAQLQAGKSKDWAVAYASMIADGQSPAFATTFAGSYEAQLQSGKSKDWADAYASMIAKGKSPKKAKAFANRKHPKG